MKTPPTYSFFHETNHDIKGFQKLKYFGSKYKPQDMINFVQIYVACLTKKYVDTTNLTKDINWKSVQYIKLHAIISNFFLNGEMIGWCVDQYLAIVTIYKKGANPIKYREKCIIELTKFLFFVQSLGNGT